MSDSRVAPSFLAISNCGAIAAAAEFLQAKQKPILLVGSKLRAAGAEKQAIELAEALGCDAGQAGREGRRTARLRRVPYYKSEEISLSLRIMSLAAGVAIRAARRLDMADKATITLTQLAATLAEEHELTKRAGRELLDNLVSLITKHLKKGERIRIAGLGILQVRKRAARMGRNPATGEAIQIKASKKVALRASKELKEAI
jgi:DNA-binding protein HU-beta